MSWRVFTAAQLHAATKHLLHTMHKGDLVVAYDATERPNPLSVRSRDYVDRVTTAELVCTAADLHTLRGKPSMAEFIAAYIGYVDPAKSVTWGELQAATDPDNIAEVLGGGTGAFYDEAELLCEAYRAMQHSEGRWRYLRGNGVDAGRLLLTFNELSGERQVRVKSQWPVEFNPDAVALLPELNPCVEVTVLKQRLEIEGALAVTFARQAWEAHARHLLVQALIRRYHHD